MNPPADPMQTLFTKNRSEELGYDVWQHFVVPPFYDDLDLLEARKPRFIIGGRGCGKTMLLRYLCHDSTFSPQRPSVPAEALRHIGIYWRADTQFAKLMLGRDQAPDVWESAFNHLLALEVATQIVASIHSIARASGKFVSADELASIDLHRLTIFGYDLGVTLASARSTLQAALWQFESWVADVRKVPEPRFLPGTRFVKALINALQDYLPSLRDSTYFVYMDEFENLQQYQRDIAFTWLKHSESPLIFNIAMKRDTDQKRTVGDESIVAIADYREHDLERYILSGDFGLFAAEVLFLNLSLAGIDTVPVEIAALRDPSKLASRRDKAYRARVLGEARALLPGLSHPDVANAALSEAVLRRRFERMLTAALRARKSRLAPDAFIRASSPEASLISLALLHRPGLTPEEILLELDKLELGQLSRFKGTTDWIHNNLVGCILLLYEAHSKACPIYAGFDTFCQLARGNLRHLLELCHRSTSHQSRLVPELGSGMSVQSQAEAARQVSADFLGEVRSFGRLGNRLHAFVLRLGSLFALSQRQPAQSEPERCHFAIVRGSSEFTEADAELLREAVKWSVLFEEEETKVKDPLQLVGHEYVLNPIYAPYFNISYRKKHRLELTLAEFHTVATGNYDDVRALLRSKAKDWHVDLDDASPTLFSHLGGEG